MRSEKKCEEEMAGNMSDSLPPNTSHFSLPNSHFPPPPPQEIAERAFAFAVRVVKLCQTLDEPKGVPRILANQLLRAGTSIGANLEESKGGQSRADFLTKVSISLKEARETRYWLRSLLAVTSSRKTYWRLSSMNPTNLSPSSPPS